MPNLFLSTLDYQFFKTKLFSRKDKHNWPLYKKQLSTSPSKFIRKCV